MDNLKRLKDIPIMRRFPLHSLSAALLLVPIACGGAPKTPEEQFTYATDDGHTATITGYTCPGGYVTIPQKIGNLRVTGIGGDAMTAGGFIDDQGALHNITSVTIPHGVRNIDTFAFYG